MIDITFISDSHNKHYEMTKDLPGGKFLVHSGDVSSRGKVNEVEDFLKWFSSLPYEHKIFIAGNHDFCFQSSFDQLSIPENVYYLIDSSVTLEGIKFYGSPWQPWFHDWAFNLPRKGIELYQKWSNIPEDTDVLITHGPPYNILDKVYRGNHNVGCELLTVRIKQIKPRISVFGHIHEANGYLEKDETLFINASSLNLSYDYINKPIVVEYSLEERIQQIKLI
jgi:Icc-related predicted phosphoesterase